MYAVPASKLDGAMHEIVPHAGNPEIFFVTFVQFAVPSFVNQTCPSFVPAQIKPFCFGDGAIAKTTSP